MCGMILRLDERRPIVWRSPHALQVGVDPVVAVLDDVTETDARLIAALKTGASASALRRLGTQIGASADRVDHVLEALSAALMPTCDEPQLALSSAAHPIAVMGTGMAAARVAGVLAERGHPVAFGSKISRVRGRRPHAAVIVATHVVEPETYQQWLRRDIAHLPVVFGEAAVTIGPLIQPGRTACLGCVHRHRVDDDPAWPAIAAQLWQTPSAAETVGLATEAAIEAWRMLQPQPATRVIGGGYAVRCDAETGERTVRHWAPHPGCGCHGLTDSAAVARPETDWEPAQPEPWSLASPRKTPVRAGRG